MLLVLYICGRRHPLGPDRDWAAYVRELRGILTEAHEIVSDDTCLIMRERKTRREVYRVVREPWPTERETWVSERSPS